MVGISSLKQKQAMFHRAGLNRGLVIGGGGRGVREMVSQTVADVHQAILWLCIESMNDSELF